MTIEAATEHKQLQNSIEMPLFSLYNEQEMQRITFIPLFLITLASLLQATPRPGRAWQLQEAHLTPISIPPGIAQLAPITSADLDRDGRPEWLTLNKNQITIFSHRGVVWQSPSEWQITQAAFTNLNRDDLPEVTLLLWRTFRPWPVDAFLPYGNRIAGFHDQQGNSCHIILIGWMNGLWKELWAGSALANPITAFAVADLTGDEHQELITLEGRYTAFRSGPAQALKVWEWSGFGFHLVASVQGLFSDLLLAQEGSGQVLILTP